MLKLKFCKNIGRNCAQLQANSVLLNSSRQVSSVPHTGLPQDANNNREFDPKRRFGFKENRRFPHSNFPSIRERQWREPIKSLKTESEQQFLIRIKNDPDMFGGPPQPEIFDQGDIQEEAHISEQVEPRNKLRTTQYADLIKGYIRERKIKDAIDVLEVKMLKEDRVKPEAYIYNLLLGACGRVGYTKKAFELYNRMKQRGLQASGGTYTALFNACANSPWASTDGLTRAKHLRQIMIEKGDQPNDTTYHAMIKAFGRCGDLPLAFTLVDEMAENGWSIRDDTMNFLIQACITDKEAGFRHSLLVWRKLVEKNIKPSVYTFNLLLRCVRDCGLGDLEVTQDVISKLIGERVGLAALPDQSVQSLQLEKGDHIGKNCEDLGNDKIQLNLSTDLEAVELSQKPNLLAPKPHLGNILSLSEIQKPEDRLLLLGGFHEFLKTMSNFKCTPDIKTFSQLLDTIPSTNAAEKQLVVAMRKLNIKPDIDFYNMLIKKKSMRCDYQGAREVLKAMKQIKYRPNVVTYGVLAIGCTTKEEALELVKEMKTAHYGLNCVILGAMLHQACYQGAYGYIFEIMELCLKEQVPVNKQFLEHLDKFKEKVRGLMETKQLRKTEEKLFGIFRARYKTWLTEVQIDETEDVHPWQQYRQNYPKDKPVNYKAKDTARFKPRHQSLFRVKTSTKYDNKYS